MRILDQHLAGLDLRDAVRGVAELKDVARDAFEGEVLVERADAMLLRQQHHVVVELVRDHAGVRDGRQLRSTARPQHAIDGVVVQVGAAAAAPGAVALGQHLHDLLELLQREVAIRLGQLAALVQLVERPFAAGRFGHELLGQRVQRLLRHADAVELAALHRVHQGGALQQVVERQRKQPPFRDRADRMAGTADPLQEGVHRTRRAELADQVDVADVDAQLERAGGDQRLQLARLQALLGLEPVLARQAAVVRGDMLLAEPLGQVAGDALGDATLVDEDERRAVLADQLGEPVVHLVPHLGGHHRGERRARHLDREIALAYVAGIDDRHRLVALPHQEACHVGERLHGGRQADAHRRAFAQRAEAFQREHQVGATLGARHRVQLVDDHALDRLEHLAARVRGEQDEERLRRGHQDVRRVAPHALALGGRRVARAHGTADVEVRQAHRDEAFADAGQRLLEVLADVVGQGLERRHVEHLHRIGQAPRQALDHQFVDGREKGRQRLARAGGRRDQRMPAQGGMAPGLGLDFGRAAEARPQPTGDGRMEQLAGGHVDGRHSQVKNGLHRGLLSGDGPCRTAQAPATAHGLGIPPMPRCGPGADPARDAGTIELN